MAHAADREGVTPDDVSVVREAHARLERGELDGFAELVAEDATWVGVTPEDGAEPATCANRAEIVETVRQNLQASLGGELSRVVPGARGMAVEVGIVGPNGRVGDWFHSVEVSGGRILRMRDAATWREALAAAGARDD